MHRLTSDATHANGGSDEAIEWILRETSTPVRTVLAGKGIEIQRRRALYGNRFLKDPFISKYEHAMVACSDY